MSDLAETVLRLAGAIVLDTLALVVWNVGTRAPTALLRDLAAAMHSPAALFAGLVGLGVGLTFVAAATVLLYPVISNPMDFAPIEIFTLLVALLVEHLIGNDLRRLAGGGKPN
ncbi:MAG: hypothetical protein GIW95_03385 [Candidatus Eremiobacteraeota bacterium]|nr:hypothetical protein [Candidatus Eremiobacteraeota bacterium]